MSDLLARLRAHEDNLVERKPGAVNAAEIRQTLVAFANSVRAPSTAILFIGVANNGEPQGVDNPDKTQKTVREQCEKVCYPPISFTTSVLEVGGKAIVAVVIPESTNRPHFSGPAYERRGSESVVASAELFEELIHRRTSKVNAILAMRSSPITVICAQHRLGSTKHVADTNYRTTDECTIEACDVHRVRMKVLASGEYVSEPLDNVRISHDEKRHRPMLIVSSAK
jgi:hypothetical protein